jgi:hypothetical protein
VHAVIVSRNEVHGVVRKAALGARLPGGTADDLANAASWMEARGLAALALALDYIQRGNAANQNIATFFDRIAVGEQQVRIDQVDLLLVGFAADAAMAYDLGFAVEWTGARVEIGPEGASQTGVDFSGPATISACVAPAAMGKVDEIVIVDEVWARANAMAAAYYVPATDASRLGGAGAGVNDND